MTTFHGHLTECLPIQTVCWSSHIKARTKHDHGHQGFRGGACGTHQGQCSIVGAGEEVGVQRSMARSAKAMKAQEKQPPGGDPELSLEG